MAERIQFLSAAPAHDVAKRHLLPALTAWFTANIGAPTLAQRFAWPAILRGENFLLSSPTGSGKTLAAFLPILSDLLFAGRASDGGTDPSLARPANQEACLHCLYIAPLKALCRDVRVNLKKLLRSLDLPGPELRIGMRTGDTSPRVRQRQLSEPPDILMTTPESLAQMLAHPVSSAILRNVRWVIIDEVHAFAGTKRGADLAVSMERLEHEALRWRSGSDGGVQRIGLSATCAPLALVAEYLTGDRPCSVAQVPDVTEKRFNVEPLFEKLDYTPAWISFVLERLDAELAACRTTLIFTNTRNLAERLTWALKRRHPDRASEIAVHHSAIHAARRRSVERRLKQGKLWTVVSSTSLELGIDVGSVDSVVFVHPPGGVVRLLQRVGRSGHRPGDPRRGLLLTASTSELLEAVVTTASGRDGQLEPVRLGDPPLDVVCQQIVGMAMTGRWSKSAAYDLIRRARPFRDLSRRDFEVCLAYLSGQAENSDVRLPVRLRWEGDCFTIADEPTAKRLRRGLGTILTEDACTIELRAPTPEDETRTQTLGELDQVFADRLQAGDRFILEGRCLELRRRIATTLLVDEVFGRPQAPRWLGAGAPMSSELALRIFLFRVQAADMLRDGPTALRNWLHQEYQLNEAASASLLEHVEIQEQMSEIPTLGGLLIESVTMQACTEYFVHTPLPRSPNDTLARVLGERFQRAYSGTIAATAADLGIYVLIASGPHLDADSWRGLLGVERFAQDFHEHLGRSELLEQSFARVAQTGLLTLRPPAWRARSRGSSEWAQHRLLERLRESAPDFVLLRQTRSEMLASCDLDAALRFLERLATLPIRIRHLREPSPFGEGLLRGGAGTTSVMSGDHAGIGRAAVH